MPEASLVDDVVGVLAGIQQVPVSQLAAQIQESGLESVTLSSHEVVAILVALEDVTGIDPSDPDILKGCNMQSLQQLVEFIAAAGGVAE